MARQTIVQQIDDLDGKPADQTVRFGLDGVSYEIDLSAKNAAALRSALDVYIVKARRVGGRSQRGAAAAKRRDPGQSQAIREWAKASGYQISDRGRISAEIVDAYQSAPSA